MNVRIRPGGIVLVIAMVAALIYRLFYTLLWERPGDNGPLSFIFPKKVAVVALKKPAVTPSPTKKLVVAPVAVAPVVVAAPTPTPIPIPATAKPLNDWLVLTPIASITPLPTVKLAANEMQQLMEKQLSTAYLANEATVQPRDGDVVNIDNNSLTWHRAKAETVNFQAIANQNAGVTGEPRHDYSVAYAITTVNLAKPVTNATLYLGSDDCVMVWLNGKLVHHNAAVREMTLGQDKVTNLSLNAGANTLVFKVGNGDGGWQMVASLDTH